MDCLHSSGQDGDGFITAEDLVKVMPRGSSIELAREMVDEVDKNRDGRVDYAEVRLVDADSGGAWA
jgi:Ca2+-binding EF-hand superfamily protein